MKHLTVIIKKMRSKHIPNLEKTIVKIKHFTNFQDCV